jgi:hypothetical protein
MSKVTASSMIVLLAAALTTPSGNGNPLGGTNLPFTSFGSNLEPTWGEV